MGDLEKGHPSEGWNPVIGYKVISTTGFQPALE
jgi:hypothetical protein